MKKKISLVLAFVVLFASISFGIGKNYFAKAEESNEFVIGTKNLNNTDENSAKVNSILKEPEIGWKRYDDSNKKITYWSNYNNQYGVGRNNADQVYNGSYTYLNYSTSGAAGANQPSGFKFNFTGKKLRLIVRRETITNPATISIDGRIISPIDYKGNGYQSVIFEINDLSDGEHYVKVTNKLTVSHVNLNLDAIDIDKDGELKPYNEDITQVNSESINLDKTSMDLLEGSSDKITATVSPEDATNKKVTWSSSDESIATVDEEGNVAAIKEGQATITAKVENTDLTATCTVNVKKPVEENKNNAILSISLVNGATKEYDVSMEEVDKFINWFEERSKGNGPSLYSFNKKVSPYKSVKEYIVHDKIASFEVREYEVTE